ncbi:hypothetical protein V8D89_002543 [Ganoderma adspersum]
MAYAYVSFSDQVAMLVQTRVSLLPAPAVGDVTDPVINRAAGDSDSAKDAAPTKSNPSSYSFKQASDSLKLPPCDFVWGTPRTQAKVIRNALPHPTIPPWLDPLDVDIDDPRKLPLCWYGVPFYPDIVFAYAERIRLGIYLKEANLHFKCGDLDIYQTWPKLVKWFKDQSGFTMHLHQVWGERKPLLTFFSNHEMARVTEENWELQVINAMLDEMEYPRECEPMWYLDRRLDF